MIGLSNQNFNFEKKKKRIRKEISTLRDKWTIYLIVNCGK